MMNITVNLTNMAIILWSGMLIVAGSIWVLCAQVRKVADLLEEHARRTVPDATLVTHANRPAARVPRSSGRGSAPARRGSRAGAVGARQPAL